MSRTSAILAVRAQVGKGFSHETSYLSSRRLFIPKNPGGAMTDFLDGVAWFRYSSIRIRRDGLEIHVDPWGVTEKAAADYVLLTHPHYDNFSEEDIAKVRGPDTVVVAPSSMKKQIGDVDHLLRPGDLIQLQGIDILAVPAHNLDAKFHPTDSGWLGYVFTVGNVTYFHAGHTDPVGSLAGVRCDVAFIPCCSDYTMGPAAAAAIAEACDASVLVPLHWDESEGGRDIVDSIQDHFSGTVSVLPRTS
jgi:L-ascorbate metabolism protein UlaG (beta-lactamase superfamily)